MIESAGCSFFKASDLWVNDEVLFTYKSKNGTIVLSRNIWDLFFIMGEQNQADIFKLDTLLSENPLFEKIEVDLKEYE